MISSPWMILGDIGHQTTMPVFPVGFVDQIASAQQESLNMKNEFDLLDVLFVVETLVAGYFIWYLWDKI